VADLPRRAGGGRFQRAPRLVSPSRRARDGGTVADIARQLSLSDGTVRNHLSSAIGKTGARTRAEAVRIAENNGWL
jgi:two-component system response regulator DesR